MLGAGAEKIGVLDAGGGIEGSGVFELEDGAGVIGALEPDWADDTGEL